MRLPNDDGFFPLNSDPSDFGFASPHRGYSHHHHQQPEHPTADTLEFRTIDGTQNNLDTT